MVKSCETGTIETKYLNVEPQEQPGAGVTAIKKYVRSSIACS